MEFDDVIEKRHSVRSFKKRNADWESIVLAIDSAIKSPFAGDYGNVKFVIVEDREKINRIAGLAQQIWINEASALVVVCSNPKNLIEMYGERGKVYQRQQAGAIIHTLQLKLVDLGLSSCWIGAYPDELIKTLLFIPKDRDVEAIIAIGEEDKKITSKTKKPKIENSLYWEKWDAQKRPTIFAEPALYKYRAKS